MKKGAIWRFLIKGNLPFLSVFMVCLFFVSPPVFSSPPELAIVSDPQSIGPDLRFEHLTGREGLSQGNVYDIMQDRRGFVWVATQNGLNRFDGYVFKVYKHDSKNPNSLLANQVRTVFEDRQGRIWIGTELGLNRFSPETETFVHFQRQTAVPKQISENVVFSIFEDSSGNLWFGGRLGVTRYDPATDTFTSYSPKSQKGLKAGSVWQFVEEDSQNVWMAASLSLLHFNPQTERFTSYLPPERTTRIGSLVLEGKERLWVGSRTMIHQFDLVSKEFSKPEFELNLNAQTLFRDHDGMIWVGTHGQGLVRVDPQTLQIQSHFQYQTLIPDSLNFNHVMKILQDQAGVFWIGTRGRGLNLLDWQQTQFSQFSNVSLSADPQKPNSIHSLYASPTGMVWVGSKHAIYRFEPQTNTVQHYFLPKITTASQRIIEEFQEDKDGKLWLASARSLFRFDPQLATFQEFRLQKPNQRQGGITFLRSISIDGNGIIWGAIRGSGLYRFDPSTEEIRVIRPPQKKASAPPSQYLLNSRVFKLLKDHQGYLWVGYQDGEISRFDPKAETFLHYPHQSEGTSPLQATIRDMLEDRNRKIWLATSQGLTQFDPIKEQFTHYTEYDGLSEPYLESIIEDTEGNLWMGTSKGLIQFNPKTKNFHNFDRYDGLHDNEFSSAVTKLNDGTLFFGGPFGMTSFHPKQLTENSYQALVLLTNLYLYNEPVTLNEGSLLKKAVWATESIQLKPKHGMISFEFTALSYAAAHKNQFRYRLEGFDAKWSTVSSSQRFATYTNLPIGTYQFVVQSTNNDGVWSSHEASIQVEVLPAWWQTIWFQMGVGLSLMVVVFGGVKWRLRSIQERNRLLENQVDERTKELKEAKDTAESANKAKSTFLANMNHELRTPLNAILGFTQIIARSSSLSSEQKSNLEIVKLSGEHLLNLINQLLDLSKIEANQETLQEREFDLYQLLTDLREMFILKANDKNLLFSVEKASNLPRYIRTDEMKLRQILINLINNALKFTVSGQVLVSALYLEKERFQFGVEDTGPGIAEDEVEQLFEAFTQTAVGKQASEGTGLGLPISRKFARLLGGDVTVRSVLGKGSTFTCEIQATESLGDNILESLPKREVIGIKPGQPQFKILIVDDQWANRHLLTQLFAPMGLDVREAENGQEAVAVWETFCPDLIWMDMRMPVMDGYTATQTIKSTPQGQSTIVIALTASNYEEEKALTLSSGCDDFLRKPFQAIDIFDRMHQHLGIEFIYQDNVDRSTLSAPPVDNEEWLVQALSQYPPEMLEKLHKSIQIIDLNAISERIEAFRQHDPQLAQEFSNIIKDFRYVQAMALLEQVMTQSSPTNRSL